jgi:hypothetical protein
MLTKAFALLAQALKHLDQAHLDGIFTSGFFLSTDYEAFEKLKEAKKAIHR